MDFLTVSKQQADKVKLEPSNRFQCQAGSRLVCDGEAHRLQINAARIDFNDTAKQTQTR